MQMLRELSVMNKSVWASIWCYDFGTGFNITLWPPAYFFGYEADEALDFMPIVGGYYFNTNGSAGEITKTVFA